MSPRLFLLGLSVPLLAVGLAAPARAQSGASAGAGPGPGWTYYGLGGGGPYVGYHPAPFGGTPATGRKPPVLTYGPVPAVEVGCGRDWVPPKHPARGYGWFGYRSPSPRPVPPTVSVYPPPPPPPPEVVAAAPALCLRVCVKLPDEGAKVWFGTAETDATGVERLFDSPPLAAGQSYTYSVTAKWVEQGKERSETKTVSGKPGEAVTADFTK